jgi:hypothetical protein
MKKAIVGVAAVGTMVVFRQVARLVGHKMREHCARMATQCQQMAAQLSGRSEAVGRT